MESLDQAFPDRKFELILAGDIIEHVNNLGKLLTSAISSGRMFEAFDCKLNARGNAAARLIMRVTGNYFLADELAVVFAPMTETVQPRST